MNSRYLEACRRNQVAILRRWTDLLQIEPGWQDVEADSRFTEFMRGILGQLWTVWPLPKSPAARAKANAMALPEWKACCCGLEIILPFLSAGKKALGEVLGRPAMADSSIAAGQRARLDWELLLAFDSIAQRGIEQKCAGCRLGGECIYSGRTVSPSQRQERG
jgi:hypothetical protein